MTFAQYEQSVEEGAPVELYHFAAGTENYYYTSAEDTITYGGNPYLSRQIGRNSPKLSVKDGRQALELTLPSSDEVCSRFVGIVPSAKMYVTATKVHRGDLTDGEVFWYGRVKQARYIKNGAQCKLIVASASSAFGRNIPTYKFQSLCNHVLYSDLCQMVEADFQFTGTASGTSGSTLTVTGLTAAEGDGWATGGKIVFGDEVRMILDQTGDVLTLSLPFPTSPDGQSVDVNAGCDHTTNDCRFKFSNPYNFGGFPGVPTVNPFVSGVR